MDGYPLVSVLIPNWNGKDDTLECLSSLSRLNYPKDQMELIVCDNGSEDDSVEALDRKFREMGKEGWRKLELVQLPTNLGIARAYNEAFNKVSADSFAALRLDNDVVLDRDALSNLVETLQAREDIGIVGGKVFRYENRSQLIHGARFVIWWLGRVEERYPEEPVECDGVGGCGMLIRKEAIDKLPFFFHHDRFLANELDLCQRVSKLGYKAFYNPGAIIYHKGARSTGRMPGSTKYLSQRESIIFNLSYAPWLCKIIYSIFLLTYAVKLAFQREWISLKAVKDAWRIKLGKGL